MMIANVSPASDQFDETLNTLKYAHRAKRIKTKEGRAQRRQRSGVPRTSGMARRQEEAAALAAMRQRQAERSAAEQSQKTRLSTEQHQRRMEAGRSQPANAANMQTGRVSNAGAGGAVRPAGAPALRRPRSDVEAATLVQSHIRGHLAREQR